VLVAIGTAWAAAIVAHATGFAHRFHHDSLLHHGRPPLGAVVGYGAAVADLRWMAALGALMAHERRAGTARTSLRRQVSAILGLAAGS
jgi:hypothetical protein